MKCQQNKNPMLLGKSSTYTKKISLKLHFFFKLIACCLSSELPSKEQKLAQICEKTQYEKTGRSINLGLLFEHTQMNRWDVGISPPKALNQYYIPISGRQKNVTHWESWLTLPGEAVFILLKKCLLSFLEGGKKQLLALGWTHNGRQARVSVASLLCSSASITRTR